MNIVDTILQFDPVTQLALGGLALTTAAWLLAMLAALVSKRSDKQGLGSVEIAVVVLSFLFVGSMTLAGRALDRGTEVAAAPVEAPSSGGGTGTCASIRPGMNVDQVKKLLGNPSLDRSAEDTRGPGARVMAFDDTRCIVRLIHGVVEQVE